ncbi:hypothetical protein GXB85_03825 [Cellulomonas sp. APG4]|uniref:Imm51 family immunity protein n=1 Tax=Cellulomonas sp. APG4 TaxID=1538656 RepID=UPI0013793B5F|nr:Imm51 family immunity protein [Cellulomonas sp. APG4]NCT90085.1 hypothetical protein [Cellulomonas sp. APG4]
MTDHAGGALAPFRLIGDETYDAVVLSGEGMAERAEVFAEHGDEGAWKGDGYDWTSVARALVAERLPHLEDELSYDPEAGMFLVRGSREALEEVGAELAHIHRDEELLRDVLSRAVPDA